MILPRYQLELAVKSSTTVTRDSLDSGDTVRALLAHNEGIVQSDLFAYINAKISENYDRLIENGDRNKIAPTYRKIEQELGIV